MELKAFLPLCLCWSSKWDFALYLEVVDTNSRLRVFCEVLCRVLYVHGVVAVLFGERVVFGVSGRCRFCCRSCVLDSRAGQPWITDVG